MRFLNRSAGRISRHRRGPVAGFLVMLLGLMLCGGLYATLAPANAEKTASTDELVKQGRELFLVGCSTCHGENGEGIKTINGNQLGPSLVGVGAAAVDFQVGTGRMPMATPAQQAPAKRKAYSEQETEALAAYVASLGPGPGVPDEQDYDVRDATQEDIARGGQIFLTNCTACHNFVGSGGAMPQGKYAPALKGVSEKHIYEAMLTGPTQMDVFSDGNLPPEDKRAVIAYLKSLEDSPNYGGFGMGGLGPVADGVFVWFVGMGSVVGFAIWIAAHTTRSKKEKAEA